MDDIDVVIIGAGICGLATALALHKKGIKAVVMERSQSLRNATGTAIGIRPNGWRALDQLGVSDTLRQTAILIEWERIISLEGGKQKVLSLTHWDGETRCLRRKDIINTLYAALPSETVKFGYHLESIKYEPHSTKPVLRFTNGNTIIAKVVIGCDGGKSLVADFLNLKPTNMFPVSAVRGLAKYPNGHSYNPEFTRFMKSDTFVGRLPVHDKLVYWFCVQPHVTKDENAWKDPEAIRKSTLELLRDHPPEIHEMIQSTDMKSLSLTNLRYRAPWDFFTGTFCKGTIVVAGDAMHIMGPYLGQGASAGLEDAVVLARTMAQSSLKCVNTGSQITTHEVEEVFNRFIKQRRMRVVRLSLQTYLTGMLLSTSSRLKKIMYIILLVLLFYNQISHVNYDCGDL